jgi:uncharacterized protein YjbJ (UPF0337 family)
VVGAVELPAHAIVYPQRLLAQSQGRISMKRNQLEGLVRFMAGKLQEKYGQLTADNSCEFEGVTRQIEGKLQSRGLPMRTAARRKRRAP